MQPSSRGPTRRTVYCAPELRCPSSRLAYSMVPSAALERTYRVRWIVGLGPDRPADPPRTSKFLPAPVGHSNSPVQRNRVAPCHPPARCPRSPLGVVAWRAGWRGLEGRNSGASTVQATCICIRAWLQQGAPVAPPFLGISALRSFAGAPYVSRCVPAPSCFSPINFFPLELSVRAEVANCTLLIPAVGVEHRSVAVRIQQIRLQMQ